MTIQRHETEAWLGDALDEMTPEQVERLHHAGRQIADRYPDPDDDADEREAALVAAAQYILGDTTTQEVGNLLLNARLAAAEALAAAKQVALMAVEDGAAEAITAREVGLDRQVIRRLRGLR